MSFPPPTGERRVLPYWWHPSPVKGLNRGEYIAAIAMAQRSARERREPLL